MSASIGKVKFTLYSLPGYSGEDDKEAHLAQLVCHSCRFKQFSQGVLQAQGVDQNFQPLQRQARKKPTSGDSYRPPASEASSELPDEEAAGETVEM